MYGKMSKKRDFFGCDYYDCHDVETQYVASLLHGNFKTVKKSYLKA